PWNDAAPRLTRQMRQARQVPPLRRPEFELSSAEPVVYYLFGNLEDPYSMVLTEDDHLDFLARIAALPAETEALDGEDRSVLPNKFRTKLSTDYLLFLGYRVNDFDFHILLRSLKSFLKENVNRGNPLIAVQLAEPTGSND